MIVTELIAKFGLQPDKGSFVKTEKSLSGLVQQATKFAHVFAGLFVLHQIEHFLHNLIVTGAQLYDTSLRLGITTKALQELSFAAGQTGVEQGELEASLRFLSRSAFDAATGGKETAAVYKRLGVNVKGANGEVKTSEQLFSEVAEGLVGVTNNTEKTALALKIFGRGGSRILPMLEHGAEGIAKLRKEAEELGGGFDPEFIHLADELEDKLKKVEFAGLAFKNAIGNAVFPLLDKGITKFLDWSKAIIAVFKGSKFLEIALIGLATASAIAAVRALIPWLPFLFTFALITAAILGTIAVIDDIHALLTGGKSLIGQYLDEWLGIGTADRLVRQWSLGIEILTNQIMGLVSVAGEAAGVIGSLFSGNFDEAAAKMLKLGDRVKAGFSEFSSDVGAAIEAYSKTVMGQNTDLAPRTAGRGINAPLMGGENTPRTTGRGIGAPLQAGSAGFGQASMDAVHSFLRPGEAEGHGSSAAANIENHVSVNVHAKTDADPEEIGRVASKKVSEALGNQNRNVRSAMVNRHK